MQYDYECPNCKHQYQEVRRYDQAQWFTQCGDCSNAEYIDVTSDEIKAKNAIEEEKQRAEDAAKAAEDAAYWASVTQAE